MKHILAILIFLATLPATAAPKRFNITNRVNGLNFIVESDDGVLQVQPEHGKPRREVPCSEVTKGEEALILERKPNEDPSPAISGEICVVDDHFTIVETDLTAERAAKEAEEASKKTERDALKLLEGKTSFSNAERDRILLYLLKEKLKNEPDAAAIRPSAR